MTKLIFSQRRFFFFCRHKDHKESAGTTQAADLCFWRHFCQLISNFVAASKPTRSAPSGRSLKFDRPFDAPGSVLSSALCIRGERHSCERVGPLFGLKIPLASNFSAYSSKIVPHALSENPHFADSKCAGNFRSSRIERWVNRRNPTARGRSRRV